MQEKHRAQGKKLRAQGSGLRGRSAGHRAQGAEEEAQGSELRAQGKKLRAEERYAEMKGPHDCKTIRPARQVAGGKEGVETKTNAIN